MHHFFQPDVIETHRLDADESHHALKVLRLGLGDNIAVLDGKGHEYPASIVAVKQNICYLDVKEELGTTQVRPSTFHLVVAPTKNLDRMEWMVEKCVEIGVAEISFVKCRYSERKELKLERLQKIAISAMKQSKNLFLPRLNELQKLDDCLGRIKQPSRYVAHLEEGNKLLLHNAPLDPSGTCVLIGPEGDFSTEEINSSIERGFKAVSLGDSTLRTETAAIVAATLVKFCS